MPTGLLVFFDIDNTLVQSSSGHMEALLRSIGEVYGLEASIEVINHHGMTDQEIIIRILEKYEIDKAAIKFRLQDCLECMPRKYAQIAKSEKIHILQGVSELLSKLEQSGIVLGLVTGNLEQIARAKLEKIGIGHFFRVGGFGSDHINRTDLVKIAVQRAEAQFDFGSHRRVFHFGDAPQDMRASREAGVVPIGVATGLFTAQQLTSAGAQKVIPDLTGADDILQYL
ncbi:MAG: HAD family hydrolase [Planctomycetota bacterium]|jgi:phosphoglycolate phosphatase-like HAD superfamily hydrolase